VQQITKPDDGELLKRFREGDREAFAVVYRAHQSSVMRFALHMTGDTGKAAELTQDVFVWLIHHPGYFDPERGALNSFLIGVARKLLQRKQFEARRWAPLDENEAAIGGVAAESLMSDTSELRSAIAALPLKYREIVVLCDLEEKTYEEAAVVVECAVGTVRSRLHRARVLLAQKILARQQRDNGVLVSPETVRCSA
jgi:RNA polymerase sigma-70 factor (ECF subfamily)